MTKSLEPVVEHAIFLDDRNDLRREKLPDNIIVDDEPDLDDLPSAPAPTEF